MDNYNKVIKCCNENNCTLLTSFEEFEKRREETKSKSYQHVRIDFVGICSHPSSAVYTNLYRRKTGIRCINCVKDNTNTILKMNGSSHCNDIEYQGITLLEEYLQPYYKFHRTCEGCKADMVIKALDEEKDEWIPLQIKVTMNNKHGMYSFRKVNREYDNMLMICICIEEKKIWIIPYNDITVKASINISRQSKYNKYLIKNTKINEIISMYKNKIILNSLNIWMTPNNIYQQREQLYIKKREQYIPFLSYKYPKIQGTKVDFMINGKKIQEKVIGFNNKKKMLICTICKNNGRLLKKSQYKPYDKGDNDYYWLHSSIDERFWIIPEDILIEKGYITTENKIGKKNLAFTLKYTPFTKWLKDYEYNYNDIDIEKIKGLFS